MAASRTVTTDTRRLSALASASSIAVRSGSACRTASRADRAPVSITMVSGTPEFGVAYQLIARARVEHRPRRATVGDLTKLLDPLRVGSRALFPLQTLQIGRAHV